MGDAGAIEGDAFALPEFTRSLRAFAAPRAVGQPAHEAIFGPLIAARRTAARMRSPDSRVAAFDAERLRRAWREAMTTIAAERTNDTAGRRAVEAAAGGEGDAARRRNLVGDLAHFHENWDNGGVPAFNVDRAQTLASIDRAKKIVAGTKATVIIQHDARDVDKLPAFPAAAK